MQTTALSIQTYMNLLNIKFVCHSGMII